MMYSDTDLGNALFGGSLCVLGLRLLLNSQPSLLHVLGFFNFFKLYIYISLVFFYFLQIPPFSCLDTDGMALTTGL